MSKKFGKISAYCTLGVASLWVVGVMGMAAGAEEPQAATGAQDSGAPSPSVQTDGVQLQQVVVTAQRRAQPLQTVPISVSVLNQATMDAQGTVDVNDLARLTPGLTFTRGAVNNNFESSDIAIRGIDSTAGAATTGIYIDDTPIQSRHLSFGTFNAYPDLFDFDRVEVLRGPQGTLFGASSEGGTVRFITPEPSLTQDSVYIRSELAGTEHGDPVYELGAAGGAPIIADTLGLRASVYARDEGGYIDRYDWQTGQLDDKNANANLTTAARVALKWAVTDNLQIEPSVFYQKRTVDDTSAYWQIYPQLLPGGVDPTNGLFNEPFRSGNEVQSPSTDRFALSAVKIDWEFGAVRLVANTSYYKRDQSAQSDYTQYDRAVFLDDPFASPGVQAPTAWTDDQKNWTQEVRLQSTNSDARMVWTAGVFYQDAAEDTTENVYDPDLLNELGVPAGNGYIYQQNPFNSLDKELALFGQTDIRLIRRLKLTLGLRVSKADFDGTAKYTGFVVGPPVASTASESEHPVTPKFGLEYQVNRDDLLYASVAKGYRIGGANPAIGEFCNLAPYGLSTVPSKYSSDHLWSYELGTKNTLDDHRLLIDGSVYYIQWDNIQQNVGLPCGFQFTSNLGAAQSRGFDLQAQFQISKALQIGGTVGYGDAKYTETVFATPAAASIPGSFSIVRDGDHLTAPPWTVALYGQLNFPLFDRNGYARADYQYSSHQSALTNAQDPANGGGGYALVPALPSTSYTSVRAGLRWGGFDVSVFAQNLFDTQPKLTSHADGPFGTPLYQVYTWRPRTIGVTGIYRY